MDKFTVESPLSYSKEEYDKLVDEWGSSTEAPPVPLAMDNIPMGPVSSGPVEPLAMTPDSVVTPIVEEAPAPVVAEDPSMGVVEAPMSFYQKTLANMSPDEKKYFSDNPDDLESFLVTSREQDLLASGKGLSSEAAFDMAYGELHGEFETMAADVKVTPVPTGTPSDERWKPRRAADMFVRAATGLVSGTTDTLIEASSGVFRLADWSMEKFGIDAFDDRDSIIYKYKEGLTEATKESIRSLGGLVQKDKNPWVNLGSDITGIFLGGYLISQMAAAGAAIQVAGTTIGAELQALGAVKSASTFLSNNQKLATVLRWSADGVAFDAASIIMAEPTTLLSVAPETFKGAIDEFENLSVLGKRGANLAEGMFINTLIGFLGAGKGAILKKLWGSTDDVSKEVLDEVAGLRSVFSAIDTDVKNTLMAPDKPWLDPLKPANVPVTPQWWEGASEVMSTYKSATEVAQVIARPSAEEVLTKVMPPDLIAKDVIGETSTGLFLKEVAKPSMEPLVKEGLILKAAPVEDLFLKSNLSPADVAEVATKETATILKAELPVLTPKEGVSLESIVTKRGTESRLSAAQVKLMDKLETEAVRLSMTTEELIDRLAKPRAAVTNVPAITQVEIAAKVKEAMVPPVTPGMATKGLQPQTSADVIVGASKGLKALRFEDTADAALYQQVKSFAGKASELTAKKAKELGVDLQRANQLLRATEKQVAALGEKTTLLVKKDLTTEVLDGVVVASGGALEGMVKSGKVQSVADALSRIAKSAKLDIADLKGKLSVNPLPMNTIKELMRTGADLSLGAVKLSGRFMDWSGMLGGASVTYLGGIDANFDGVVDFKDLAIGALGFTIGGILSARSAVRKENLEKLGTDALVKYLEADNQRVASVYLATKEVLENSRHTLSSNDIPRLESVVKKLEKYLLGTNDNVSQLLGDPEVIKRIKGASAVSYSQNDLVNLGNTLRMNKEYLPADSPFTIGKHNFINPATFADEFDILYKEAAQVFQANEAMLTPVHLTSALNRMVAELGVSKTAKDMLFKGSASEAAARIHVARGLLASIDAEIKTIAKLPALDERLTQDLILRINQRRSIGEFLRNGGIAGGDSFLRAQGQATKAALLGMNPNSYLSGLAFSKQTMETMGLAKEYLKELDGARMTKFMDELGANMTMGQAGVQALYMSLFSNPLTWGKAWVENTLSVSTALLSEGMSTAYGVATGVSTSQAFLGQRGFVAGLLSNLGGRLKQTIDVMQGKSLGFDVGHNKEFADIRNMTKMQYEMGLKNAGMWTRGMNHLMKWVGIDPIAMTMAPDVFYKGLLFDAYQQKHLVEAAFDNTRSLKGLSIDDAIKDIEGRSEAMEAIRVNSLKKARDYTFTSDLSQTTSLTQKLIDMRSANSILRMLLPVFKTPLVASRHFMRHTPLLGMLVGEDRRLLKEWASMTMKGEAIPETIQRSVLEIGGRMTAGLLTMSAAYYGLTTMGFDIIGSGKFDPGFQAKAEQGIRPFSVVDRKTGESLSLERAVHFRGTLGLMADIKDKIENYQQGEPTDEDHGVLEAAGFAMSLVFENFAPDQATDMLSLFGAIRNEDAAEAKLEGSWMDFAGRVMPSIFRAVGNDADPIKRATNDQIERALASYYAGIGEPQRTRPSLDLYGEVQRKDKPLVNDPMLLAAEDAGYPIRDYMKRRATVGGVKLGSSTEEQEVALRAERLHGEVVQRMAPNVLAQVNRLTDSAQKKEVLSRFFQTVTRDVTQQLKQDSKVGATVRRLLDKGGSRQ